MADRMKSMPTDLPYETKLALAVAALDKERGARSALYM